MYDIDAIEKAVRSAVKDMNITMNTDTPKSDYVKIGVSQRHIHLSREDLDVLFGKGYELTPKKVLMGKEFASNEVVTLVGPSLKAIENVRVLGPVRKNTQVEISRTDTFVLKVSPPVRPSGEIKGSEKLVVVGPKGSIYLKEGVIIANRHIHLTPEFAKDLKLKDNDYVDVVIDGVKPTKFYDVQIRVREDFNVEMHIDTDDANSSGLKNGDVVHILTK